MHHRRHLASQRPSDDYREVNIPTGVSVTSITVSQGPIKPMHAPCFELRHRYYREWNHRGVFYRLRIVAGMLRADTNYYRPGP